MVRTKSFLGERTGILDRISPATKEMNGELARRPLRKRSCTAWQDAYQAQKEMILKFLHAYTEPSEDEGDARQVKFPPTDALFVHRHPDKACSPSKLSSIVARSCLSRPPPPDRRTALHSIPPRPHMLMRAEFPRQPSFHPPNTPANLAHNKLNHYTQAIVPLPQLYPRSLLHIRYLTLKIEMNSVSPKPSGLKHIRHAPEPSTNNSHVRSNASPRDASSGLSSCAMA
ncbi:hypothetical protein FNV43_RR06326 [Rhamnella rubrinervis]|uniref:Uncharacterized protein n=1 Tax=Rhamnella rubrinervis TaxID=2594499 RepID=A0A8K0ML70_9ROSA|nr:hypothetical protein FNV43_RR06326 [Rhamnella rubrinervis]